jgi:hypothetical protein
MEMNEKIAAPPREPCKPQQCRWTPMACANVGRCLYADAQVPPPPAPADALIARITGYLSTGGLFNPELAQHDAVRDLLIDCRDRIAALDRDNAMQHEGLRQGVDRIAALTAERDKLQELANDGIHAERAALIRATKAEARADAMRDALRNAVIDRRICNLCKTYFGDGGEQHVPGCLAALDAALKEPK